MTSMVGPDETGLHRYQAGCSVAQIIGDFGGLGPNEVTGEHVQIAGRLLLIRRHGGLIFAQLRDRSGEVQLVADRAVLGGGQHAVFAGLRRGDWVGVSGVVMTTRSGELSVLVEEFVVLARANGWAPDKRGGLTDTESRYRRRYLDLAVNERTREIFRIRHSAIRAIRDHLTLHGFIEVETPVLHTAQTGAAARPFVTRHNALDMDLYLRIAPELHLKRLIVGGMGRVFELGRVFRNEGIDARHNPEFTLLEAYQAFADYHDMMDLVEDLVCTVTAAVLDGTTTLTYRNELIDLSRPWPRVRFAELIAEKTGAVMHPGMPIAAARAELDRLNVRYEDSWGSGRLMQRLYDDKVQHAVVGPLFCVDYPREVSPLARAHRADPAYAERFELIVGGAELCNAYSEQNDPVQQLAAFQAEAHAKANGDDEAGDVDEDFIFALEQGMPPTGGLGLGIDRLVMLLSGAESIREVILFPTLRPQSPPHVDRSPDDGGDQRISSALEAAGPAPAGMPPPVVRHALAPDAGVRLIAIATALGGLLQLLAPLPVVQGRLGSPAQLGPVWLPVAGYVVSVIIGLLLVLLADQLAKGKRAAWRVAVALFGVAATAHVLKGPHLIATGFCVVMLAALLLARRRFTAPPDPPSLLRLVRFVPLYFTAVLVFGFTALVLEQDRMQPQLSIAGGLDAIFSGLISVDGPFVYQSHFFADFFPAALAALGVLGVVVFAVLLFRPLAAHRRSTGHDWAHAQRLVSRYGWDTLAYFALRRDKSWFFSADGEAMLAYTYLSGYALVSGDPIGARGSASQVVDEFLTMCQHRAWNPAFLAIREHDMPFYAARGFRSFYLGDEAVLRCDTFSTKGRKALRGAVRRVGRRYRFQILPESQASPELVARLNAISRRWRGKAAERGFTMSLGQNIVGPGTDPDRLLCLALDDHDEPAGFLRIVPAHGALPGYTLDLMRRDPAAPNGITEFLISSTALALRERGIVRFSLNFALWGRLFAEGTSFTPTQRLARWAIGLINPFFQIKSLHDFNARFSPEWLPRVLAYRRPSDLPRVGLLYAGAEGFLAVPGIGDIFLPPAPDDAGRPAPSPTAGERAKDPTPH